MVNPVKNKQVTTSFSEDNDVYQIINKEAERCEWQTRGSLNTTARRMLIERAGMYPHWRLFDYSTEIMLKQLLEASDRRKLLVKRVLDMEEKDCQALDTLISGILGTARKHDNVG